MKTCTQCKQSKELSEFSKQKKGRNGLTAACKACCKQWKVSNKERQRQNDKQWYQDNKGHMKQQYQDNKGHRKQYYQDNKEHVKQRYKRWRLANLDKCNAYAAQRRAAKLNATPPWLTKEDFKKIEAFYTLAKDMEARDGIKYHVDHIHPLQGENLCGLHVPWNLQVIPATENLSKSNRIKE